MEELRSILECIQYLTNETWRFEIYGEDHMTYKLFCPNPKQDKYYQMTLEGQWLDDLIEKQDDIDYTEITKELEKRL